MKRGDPRIREVFSQLRQVLDLLEDITSHPHQVAEEVQAAPPRTMPEQMPPDGADKQPVPMLVSIKEARRLIGISNSYVYLLISSGALETVQIGKRRLVRYSSLQKLAGR